MNLLFNRPVYELGYQYFRMPYDTGPGEELVKLLESGRILPCRAVDPGCGTGRNVIFPALHGFEVTGVDSASSAVAKAKRRVEEAGIRVEFVVDDLTNLRKVKDAFDFLVDYGTLDVLHFKDRDVYIRNVLPFTHAGSQFFLCGWEWPLSWWEGWLLLLVRDKLAMTLMILLVGNNGSSNGPLRMLHLV